MWDWVARIDDPSKLEELASEARDSLANPFTSQWGVEHNEYLLHDVSQRLSELASAKGNRDEQIAIDARDDRGS